MILRNNGSCNSNNLVCPVLFHQLEATVMAMVVIAW